jgi:hypothetical protein
MKDKHTDPLNENSSLFTHLDASVIKKTIEESKNTGETIFTAQNCTAATYPITKIMRLLCIKFDVTKDSFARSYENYALETGMSSNTISYSRNNLRKSLDKDDISWTSMERFLEVIGCELVEVSLTLRNTATNEIFTIKDKDADDLARKAGVESGVVSPKVMLAVPRKRYSN